MHGWVVGDVATEGLASDIQRLFAFQSVHIANTGKPKLGETLGRRGGIKNKTGWPLPCSLNAILPHGRGDATGI